MKVIGEKISGNYLCEVSHTELEKFMNLYFGDLKRLKEGDELDLRKGYDFYHDTQTALNTTQKFIKAHDKVIKQIMTGIKVMGVHQISEEKESV